MLNSKPIINWAIDGGNTITAGTSWLTISHKDGSTVLRLRDEELATFCRMTGLAGRTTAAVKEAFSRHIVQMLRVDGGFCRIQTGTHRVFASVETLSAVAAWFSDNHFLPVSIDAAMEGLIRRLFVSRNGFTVPLTYSLAAKLHAHLCELAESVRDATGARKRFGVGEGVELEQTSADSYLLVLTSGPTAVTSAELARHQLASMAHLVAGKLNALLEQNGRTP